jgi:hypothetical protein
MNPTTIRSHLFASAAAAAMAASGGAHVRSLNITSQAVMDAGLGILNDLRALGVSFNERDVRQMMAAMDANVLQPTIQGGSMTTPAQFLQNWLPGIIRTITAARKIDELVGITVGGSWEDEEVIQTILEPTGLAVPYGDYTNVPLSSWQNSYERRSVVRFEEGLRVGRLEDARASRININSASEKRGAAGMALELQRNRVGFYGYNGGANRTYGFLNDPNLPAYVTVAAGVGGTTWALKTYLEITADIRSALSSLRTNSGDIIDPETTSLTLALPTSVVDYLSVTSEFGNSVRDWMTKTYPRIRVVSAPELVGANGGANVFYLYADIVVDGSSDGGQTFAQFVPAKFQTLGVEQQAKAYIEDYTNALAGVMVKRPFAVVRRSGC